MIPLLLFAEIEFVGRVFVTEVALVISFALLWRDALIARRSRTLVSIIVLGAVWLFGQITTDLVVATPLADLARGWSKIGVTVVDLVAIYALVGDSTKRLLLFGVGLAVAFVIGYFVDPNLYAVGDPWKWAFAESVALASVVVGCLGARQGVSVLAPALLIVLAAANLVGDFRSLAGVCFVTAVYLGGSSVLRRRRRITTTFTRVVVVALVAAVAAWALVEIYGLTAREGLIGWDAQVRYETQSSGAFGFLVGGRREILVSTQAIADSPLIGHGSWAKDYKYVDLLSARLEDLGYRTIQDYVLSGLIPSHSFLLGAWVESGIAGAAFWFFILGLLVKNLVEIFGTKSHLVPLVAFLGFNLLWDILFSPFGAQARVTASYTIVALLFAGSVDAGTESP